MSFIFRCPNMDRKVQGWTAEEVFDGGDTYLPQQCAACRQIHYINPNTGRVLGSDDADDKYKNRRRRDVAPVPGFAARGQRNC
jgi:hypothetical protein